ncbi:MAG: hypothetical protein IJE84_06120 [Clostridia bacterium]|nr:hypothetical protein [Clostridia bacterium]
MLCTALVTIPVAVYFSSVVSGRIFSVLLGVVLIALSTYFLFFFDRIKLRPTLSGALATGAVSGVLGGLFSTSGPPVVLYLSYSRGESNSYRF